MDKNTPEPGQADRLQALSDEQLREEIQRMFSNWCWISGDPDEKAYYGLLLEESDRRKQAGGDG